MSELPSNLPPTEALGVFQGGIVLKTALEAAFKDLRANPWLLDYIWRGVEYDLATNKQYGKAWTTEAKKWFQNTNIEVFYNTTLSSPNYPCISIALLESAPTNETLGDIHYTDTEVIQLPGKTIAGPFVPAKYNTSTGELTLPSTVDVAPIFPGQFVVTRSGKSYQITDVSDDGIITLSPGVADNFTNCTITGGPSNGLLHLESTRVRESYAIVCHVQSDPVELIFLHSLVVWCLLAYKEDQLEGRGFENTSFSSTDFSKRYDTMESMYSRAITLSGIAQIRWVKRRVEAIAGVTTKMVIPDAGPTDASIINAIWETE